MWIARIGYMDLGDYGHCRQLLVISAFVRLIGSKCLFAHFRENLKKLSGFQRNFVLSLSKSSKSPQLNKKFVCSATDNIYQCISISKVWVFSVFQPFFLYISWSVLFTFPLTFFHSFSPLLPSLLLLFISSIYSLFVFPYWFISFPSSIFYFT